MKYRFVVEIEQQEAPPGHTERLKKILARELNLQFGSSAQVVSAGIVVEPGTVSWNSDEYPISSGEPWFAPNEQMTRERAMAMPETPEEYETDPPIV